MPSSAKDNGRKGIGEVTRKSVVKPIRFVTKIYISAFFLDEILKIYSYPSWD